VSDIARSTPRHADTEDLDVLQARAEAEGRRAVVAGLVVNADGKAFVHRRGPDRQFLPNGWDTLGGHVEDGESLLGALAREVEEESGWRVAGTPKLIYVVDWETTDDGSPYRRREFDFLIEVDGDLDHPRLEMPQHTEYRWIGRDELDLLDENGGKDHGIVRTIVAMALNEDAGQP
jgi:8-oxo-dGTP pyrophosphatase MutT (NUDIX family)